ncbi:E3 ubiquitin-protein ligase pellino homolog 2-like isoform X1 [Carassius auratus]|uniref:E3 ubiquitin-protein ligase pellino homolog 2-like isoform X1 n=1 Tax=Carassius auratus TaxID=7957 RepID=A0A6P6N636_CARAU|nr:E3 ubiquitin-protein ligase pellino homolog 2-like isoform X1 [Carassius auratus]
MLVCVLSVSVCVCALCKMSRFALHRRTRANGVKPSTVHILSNPHNSEAVNSRGQHSISFTLSRNQTVVVEYCHEDHTDMFQVGRSTESPIDFMVTDTQGASQESEDSCSAPSTISPKVH